MFNIGDQVLYTSHGACTIVGIESMRFGKTRGKYYVLKPFLQEESRYYVPVDKDSTVSKLRPLMSRQELEEMMGSEAVRANNWIPEENLRKLRYKELISNGDRFALLNMIYCLYMHKEEQRKVGKKFHQCDENFLHDALRVLSSELCCVFSLEPENVQRFLMQQMGLDT